MDFEHEFKDQLYLNKTQSKSDQTVLKSNEIAIFQLNSSLILDYFDNLAKEVEVDMINHYDEFAEPPLPKSIVFKVGDQLCFGSHLYHFIETVLFIYLFFIIITVSLIVNYTYIKPVLLKKRI